jgi:toxin ParE1/3/4
VKIWYTDRSKDDLETAFVWYERQRRGLGFEFLDCVEAAIQGIRTHPEMYPVRYREIRGCPLRRFPFSIFYSLESPGVVLHSVFHSRQDPQKMP